MQKENKLGSMPIKKLIWDMSLPIIASMLVQALYNIVDSMFVSRVSQDALTAVSLAFPAQTLIISFAAGTAVGVNALMGRALGAKNPERASAVAVNGVFLALVSAIVTAILGLSLAGVFFRAQTNVVSISSQGQAYLRIVTGCSFAVYGQVMFERLLQGTGRTKLSMYTQGLGAIINIILDPVFIFTFKLGVAGAAIATIIGQCCGCALAIWFNFKKNKELTLNFRTFRPNGKIIGNIYAIGLPSIIMMAIGSVMNFLMNKILITYHAAHETAATAFGIYFKLNSFIFMPINGLNNGIVPIISYSYGAQNRRRMMETVKRSVVYAVVMMLVGMCIFELFPGTLLKIFKAEGELMAVGIPCLRLTALSFSMAGICIALGTVMQALGKAVFSMINSLVRQLIFLVPSAYVLARYGAQVGNSDLVWWCYPIAEIASLTLTVIFFIRVYRTLIVKIPMDGPEV